MAKSGYISPEGTARKTQKIYLGDDDSLARKITKAYIGDDNDLAREWFSSGIPISTLAVGSSVFMNVDGVSTEFLVVNQGLPSSVYDSSCNGTWLLMKNILEQKTWSTSGYGNDYANSTIHNTYLNVDFISQLDAEIQSTVKQIKLPYTNGTGKNGSVASGSDGLLTKAFLLSAIEVGITPSNCKTEGAVLKYFDISSSDRRIAYFNGSSTKSAWWLRSPYTGNVNNVFYITTNGSVANLSCMAYSFGLRPALVLPTNAVVDESFNVLA